MWSPRIILRRLFRDRLNALIQVGGLATAVTCVVLTSLYVVDAFRFDRFHPNADRTYRLMRQTQTDGNLRSWSPGVSGGFADLIAVEIPEVLSTMRLWDRYVPVWVRANGRGSERSLTLVDANVFDVFDVPLRSGHHGCLAEPDAAVISAELAVELFGESDPIGHSVDVEDRIFGGRYVVGAVADFPKASRLRTDVLISRVPSTNHGLWERWRGPRAWRPIQLFVQVSESADPAAVEAKITDLVRTHFGEEALEHNRYRIQSLERAHLYGREDFGTILSLVDRGATPDSDIVYVRMVGLTALLILVIASVNYVSLTTAHASQRAVEIGIRKAVGAERSNLVGQFLSESIATSLIASAIGVAAGWFLLPYFNQMLGKQLEFPGPGELALVVPFSVLLGLAAGAYPAWMLASLNPIVSTDRSHNRVIGRRILVGAQFALAIVLSVSAMIVHQQLTFIRTTHLGYNTDHLVILPIFGIDWNMQPDGSTLLAERSEAVKSAFLEHPNVLKATSYRYLVGPLGGGSLRLVRVEDHAEEDWRVRIQETDPDFLDTFEIDLVAGRNLRLPKSGDREGEIVVNQTAARQLGWTDQEAIGKTFRFSGRTFTVVGVCRDFHNHSLRQEIEPMGLCSWYARLWNLGLRVRPDGMDDTVAFLEDTWARFMPDRAFTYSFTDASLEAMYREERRLGTLSSSLSLVAVLIACIGLFGLAAFNAAQRTKEIGIRKAVGAGVSDITALLSSEFGVVVMAANLVGVPVAYAFTQSWLDGFAFRVELTPWPFLAGCGLTLAAASLSVGYQTLKAARQNPVVALRSE